jgi:hypothetical protein
VTDMDEMTAPTVSDKPQFYKVRLTHPSHNRKTVFRSVSPTRAQAFVENRFPRGSEAYLESPDGVTTHYEAERQGENGTDAEKWAPFDPDSWEPVDTQSPPGDSPWADKEG